MPIIAPWLRPTDVLGAMEGGSRIGLAQRSAADQEAAQSAQQQSAADKLKLSYDSLAADQANRQAQMQMAQQENAAAMALRKQQADALMAYRQQQASVQNARLQDQESKQKAVEALANAQEKDTQGLQVDLASGDDEMDAIKKHPHADKNFVHTLLESYLQNKRQEQAAKRTEKAPVEKGAIDFAAPGQSVSEAGQLTRFTGIPLGDPIINQVLGTNAPPGTGTNRLSSAQRLSAAPKAQDPLSKAALPIPKKADLKQGVIYMTPRGPAAWDGENFVLQPANE